jgi:serine/threonine protein kinase
VDVGNGLDAIHHAGLVHGDLKPANVLIFRHESLDVPFIAKLADFGASVSEPNATEGTKVTMEGFTPEWSAPEISADVHRLSIASMIKADTFSYGLLSLSVSCCSGNRLSGKEVSTAIQVVTSTTDMPQPYRDLLLKALPLLMHFNPERRPREVRDLFMDESEQIVSWSARTSILQLISADHEQEISRSTSSI